MSILPKSNVVTTPTLCLNMIVKNESTVITRLLESVLPYIDSYCICDTGSTDNTIEIIETFFLERNIPGKIVQEPFRDFGYNRTVALKSCENMENADYILLLDADMIFQVLSNNTTQEGIAAFKKLLLTGDTFYIFQGNDQFYYKNTRITKNNCGTSYWGVTHEYLQTPPGSNIQILPKNIAFIYDIGDGGCKTNKFERDIKLLEQGLIDHPNNDRYTFYLANSYRNAGQIDNAIAMYKKRIAIGGWVDEIWNSYYSIGQSYKQMGDIPNAIHNWMEAYNAYPERIESLYEIVQYYRIANKPKLAYEYYHIAKQVLLRNYNKDYLFMQKDVYDYKLDYEMTIFGFYCKLHNYDLQQLVTNVLNYTQLPASIRKNVWSNYKFYSLRFSSLHTGQHADLGKLLMELGMREMEEYPDFVPSTPSLAKISENRIVAVKRFVNYRIDENGKYQSKSTIESKNVLGVFQKNDNGIWSIETIARVKHNTEQDGHYIGVEDMRLFEQSYDATVSTILYSGNRGMKDGTMTVEIGRLHLDNGTTSEIRYPKIAEQGRLEKNWVWLPTIETIPACNKMIYGWNPLTIGTIETVEEKTDFSSSSISMVEEKTYFHVSNVIPTPGIFTNARGSTNGIVVNDDIWFVVHLVNYEDRRHYYHILVCLDKNTHLVTKHTKPFTFDNNKVEYTLGFVYDNQTDTFLIGYSVMDCETKMMVIPRSKIM
jgi:tetratricopeptide (TPR) repeat protein